MHILVMRHGEAGWQSMDQQRELTESGREACARVASDIARSRWRPDLIWCSDLVRAQQTAAIASELLNVPVQERHFLTPDHDPGECLDELINDGALPKTLLIVSHMPLVGTLSTLLVDGHRRGIPLMTSQAVVIDMPILGPGCGDVKAQFMA